MNRAFAALLATPLLIAAPASAAPADSAIGELQRTLEDPDTQASLDRMVRALTDAVLNLPVGEIQAAAEGRPATASEKRLTVRDMGRRDDPQFDVKLKRKIAEAGPTLRQSMRSLATSLPALAKSFEEAGRAVERATTNLPDPTYPKR